MPLINGCRVFSASSWSRNTGKMLGAEEMEARLEGRSLEVLEGCSVEESLRDWVASGSELRFFPRRPWTWPGHPMAWLESAGRSTPGGEGRIRSYQEP